MTNFMDDHPGGSHILIKMIGKDATTAFFGGVYDHSNAAHNVSAMLSFYLTKQGADGSRILQLLAMKRVGVLHGGQPHGLEDRFIPPSQRLKIARYNELGSSHSGSSTAYSDSE